jgi:hypothetical protein
MLFMQMFSKLLTGFDDLSEQVVKGVAMMQLQEKRTCIRAPVLKWRSNRISNHCVEVLRHSARVTQAAERAVA